MKKLTPEKIRKLKQKTDVWEVAVRLGRTWVTSDDDLLVRPWFVIVVSQDDKVVRTATLYHEPPPDEIWETVLQAMRRPMLGAGGKHRPQRIIFDDQAFVDIFAPRLTEIDVKCAYQRDLGYLNSALVELERMLNRDFPEMESLLSIPGVSVPLLGEVFKAAAEFYELAPWEKFPYEFAMEIHAPADAPPRYAVVMGGGGESYGLFVTEDFVGLQRIFNQFDPEGVTSAMTAFSLTYDTAVYFAFDDLDAITRYDWPIAGERAYPSMVRFTPNDKFQLPARRDILWLEAVLPALTEFFEQHFQLDAQGHVPSGEYTFDIDTLSGPVAVSLSLPVDVSPQE